MEDNLNRKNSPNSQKGIIAVLLIAVLALAAVLIYVLWPREDVQTSTINSFDECIAAGNPVMESQPRQCHDPVNGVTFTEEAASEQNNPEEQAHEALGLVSDKGISIELDNLQQDQVISSPFTLTGHVSGNWSSEASFSVDLVSEGGQVIATVPATIQGDWMTTEMVPFTVTLTFDDSNLGDSGKIILHKANPSGLLENDDKVELPVRFSD